MIWRIICKYRHKQRKLFYQNRKFFLHPRRWCNIARWIDNEPRNGLQTYQSGHNWTSTTLLFFALPLFHIPSFVLSLFFRSISSVSNASSSSSSTTSMWIFYMKHTLDNVHSLPYSFAKKILFPEASAKNDSMVYSLLFLSLKPSQSRAPTWTVKKLKKIRKLSLPLRSFDRTKPKKVFNLYFGWKSLLWKLKPGTNYLPPSLFLFIFSLFSSPTAAFSLFLPPFLSLSHC